MMINLLESSQIFLYSKSDHQLGCTMMRHERIPTTSDREVDTNAHLTFDVGEHLTYVTLLNQCLSGV